MRARTSGAAIALSALVSVLAPASASPNSGWHQFNFGAGCKPFQQDLTGNFSGVNIAVGDGEKNNCYSVYNGIVATSGASHWPTTGDQDASVVGIGDLSYLLPCFGLFNCAPNYSTWTPH